MRLRTPHSEADAYPPLTTRRDTYVIFDVYRIGVTQDIIVETHGNCIVVDMPGTSYRVRYRRPSSGRQLIAYGLPKTDDPTAGITSAYFMDLAWGIATKRARQLGWIA
jgi:hypothetical protein